MDKIMAILTKERQYAERLCGYINNRMQLVVTAVPFDNVEECRSFGRTHPIEVLLADRDLYSGSRYGAADTGAEAIHATRKLILTGGWKESADMQRLEEDGGAFSDGGMIFKYQSAEGILREVMENCGGMELRRTAEAVGRPVRIIGVYSPVGRSGCSSFAMTLAKVSNRRRHTLYLNCSEFSGMSRLTGEHYTTGISDAMYHLKQGQLSCEKIYSMIYRFSGIDYLPPVSYAEDHETLKGEDYVQLITTLLRNTDYEVIAVDMDSFSNAASEIMDICDVVYMPVLDDSMAMGKGEEFEEYLRIAGRERLLGKLVRIRTPYGGLQAGSASYMDSLAYGPMGDLVRELGEG